MDVLIYFSFMTAVVVSGKQHTNQTDIDASRNGSTGIITSPGYPGNYPDNVTYTWTLKTGNPNATVSFNVKDFDIIKYWGTPHCEDYLQIYRTEPCCYRVIHRCGIFEPFNQTVDGSVITINFVSDNLHNTKGFNLTWIVNIPLTPSMSKTSLWTSTLQVNFSAKIMSTTGHKKLGTTDVETPTAKTENVTKTSSRHKELDTTDSDTPTTQSEKVIYTRPRTQQISKNCHEKNVTVISVTKFVAERNIIVATAQMASHKHNTYTTDTTRKTSTLKPTELTTQQQNSTTGDLDIKIQSDEIIYLVAGIGVVELTLVALAIYIVRQRRSNMSIGQNDKDKTHQVSRKSVVSVGNVYESIPLGHFSIKDAIPEEDEDVYTEVPEHMYDKTFEHRPHVNVNPNLYQLLSELKTKNR